MSYDYNHRKINKYYAISMKYLKCTHYLSLRLKLCIFDKIKCGRVRRRMDESDLCSIVINTEFLLLCIVAMVTDL